MSYNPQLSLMSDSGFQYYSSNEGGARSWSTSSINDNLFSITVPSDAKYIRLKWYISLGTLSDQAYIGYGSGSGLINTNDHSFNYEFSGANLNFTNYEYHNNGSMTLLGNTPVVIASTGRATLSVSAYNGPGSALTVYLSGSPGPGTNPRGWAGSTVEFYRRQ